MDDIEVKKLFGKKIKNLRDENKMSQEDLSVKLEITQRQVSMIERGLSFPKLQTLNKLANIFKCNIQDLFDYSHLQSQEILKTELKKIIDDYNSEKIRTLYLIAKNLH